jgi:Na+:H+ antiporter
VRVADLGCGVGMVTAYGFLVGILLFAGFIIPRIVCWVSRLTLLGTPTILAILVALALAWLAHAAGSAPIIGAFAAGVLVWETPQAHDMERGVAQLGQFFVPLFFVTVGAAVDIGVFNAVDSANRQTLVMGGLLIAAAAIGKLLAGYAAFWFKDNKKVIGVGMIPRGEVGLIFAQLGLASNAFDAGLFSAVTRMVMVTTFLAPPLLRLWFPPIMGNQPVPKPEGIKKLAFEP